MERQMKEKMEQTSVHELMPGFDTELEWQELNKQLHPPARQVHLVRWYYAAAAIAAIIISGLVWQMMQRGSDALPPVVQSQPNTPAAIPDTNHPKLYNLPKPIEIPADKTIAHTTTPKHREVITNGTPCPIAIRINQMMNCPDARPAAISTKSTMEPGQTAQLTIKPRDSAVAHCSFTVREIEITSIATGETIVLNESSTPTTAQEVYSYITGQKKGDVLAGMFTADCNNQRKKQRLTLARKDGSLVLQ